MSSIQPDTQLEVVDNSGADVVRTIKVLGSSLKSKIESGTFVTLRIITLKKTDAKRSIRKSRIHTGLIVRTNQESFYYDGTVTRFKKHGVILLNNKKSYYGTRIFGPVSKRLRSRKFLRVILMCGKKYY